MSSKDDDFGPEKFAARNGDVESDVEDRGTWKRERGMGKTQLEIDFVKKDGLRIGFPYSSLVKREFLSDDEGNIIVLTFLADEMTKVILRGIKLFDLFSDIRRHRCFEVVEAIRSFGQEGVSRISVEVVKEEPQRR